MFKAYPAIIYKEPETDFGVVFPDLPGCFTTGETVEEAHEMAAEAAELYVETLLEDGKDVAPPSSLEATYELLEADEYKDTVAGVALITVRQPARAKRINITLDENLLTDIDRHAADLGEEAGPAHAEAARRVMTPPEFVVIEVGDEHGMRELAPARRGRVQYEGWTRVVRTHPAEQGEKREKR